MSGLIDKIKDAVHGDKHHSSSNDPAGPKGHDSHAANKADPRVDSDRDGRADPTTGTTHRTGAGLSSVPGTHTSGHTGTTGTHTGTHTGTTGGLGSTGYGNTSTNAGPHDSNLANKADPRVDSDRDHRAGGIGSTGNEFGSSRTAGTSEFGSTTRSGAEYGTTGSSTLGSSTHTSANTGPHSSNLANKADPRVDSDRDHRANPASGGLGSNTGTYGSSTTGTHGTHTGAYDTTGTAGTHTGTTGGLGSTGYGNTSTNAGPHDSNIANKADPRVDSDRDHRGNLTSGGLGSNTGTYGSSTTGSHNVTGGAAGLNNPGPAPNTAGPHSKDFLNKADPRVDSDRDGSKTVGQDQTYARS